MAINLFDLMWEDILIPKVVPHLTTKDLYNLSLCSKESKRFVNLALKSVKKCNLSFRDAVSFLPTLTENCRNLTTINVWNFSDFDVYLFIVLLKNNPNLIILDINIWSLQTYNDDIVEVFQSLQKLEEFNLNTYHNTIHNSEDLMLRIFECLPNLRIIKAGFCFTDKVIQTIAKNCRKLERLDLSNPFGHVTDNAIEYLVSDCFSLKWLRVNFIPESANLFETLKERGVNIELGLKDENEFYGYHDDCDDHDEAFKDFREKEQNNFVNDFI